MYLKFSIIFVLISIFYYSNLNGQVKYDTSIIKTKPCTVKKVTLNYDTSSLKVKDSFQKKLGRDKCRVELKWPIFKNCGNPQIDSSLNSLKKLVMERLFNNTPRQYCLDRRGYLDGRIHWERFDERFLSFYFEFVYFSGNGSENIYKYINYDFERQSFIGLWGLFKPDHQKETIKKRIRELNGFEKNKSIGIEGGCLLNFKDKIVINNCGGPVLYQKLTVQKGDIKKLLRNEYYHGR